MATLSTLTPRELLPLLRTRPQAIARALAAGERLPLETLRHSVRVLSDAGAVTLALGSPSNEVAIDEAMMAATFTVSTPRKDRMGDVVVPRGCLPHLDNYRKNPRVFFAHKSSDFTIGSARDPQTGELALQVHDDKIVSTCYFHGETAESECVFRLVKRKELQATSIGFLPVLASIIKDDDEDDKPRKTEGGERVVDFGSMWMSLRFLEWDLTEWSVVPVPANPDACEALSATLSRGHVEGERIPLSLKKALEPFRLKARVWSPGFNPESQGFTGTLALGESEVEYKAGKLVRIDAVSLAKDDDTPPPPDAEANADQPEVPSAVMVVTEAPKADTLTAAEQEVRRSDEQDARRVITLDALELTVLVERAVEAAFQRQRDAIVKEMSALNEAGGGALGGDDKPKDKGDDYKQLAVCCEEIHKAVQALAVTCGHLCSTADGHAASSGKEHAAIMAGLDALQKVDSAAKAQEALALKAQVDAIMAQIADTNRALAARAQSLTGRRSAAGVR